MKKSKKCPLCNLDESFHDELLRKKLLLGSIARAAAWFQHERPTPEITEYRFMNHFRRHVTPGDYERVKLKPQYPIVKTQLAPVIMEKEGLALTPHVELGSLFMVTVQRINSLTKLADADSKADELLLKYLGECRKQLQLLHEIRPSLESRNKKDTLEEPSGRSPDISLYGKIIMEEPEAEVEEES